MYQLSSWYMHTCLTECILTISWPHQHYLWPFHLVSYKIARFLMGLRRSEEKEKEPLFKWPKRPLFSSYLFEITFFCWMAHLKEHQFDAVLTKDVPFIFSSLRCAHSLRVPFVFAERAAHGQQNPLVLENRFAPYDALHKLKQCQEGRVPTTGKLMFLSQLSSS